MTPVMHGSHVIIYGDILAHIQAKNRTNVTPVVYSSHSVIIYGDIFAHIQVKNRTNAMHLGSGFHINVI